MSITIKETTIKAKTSTKPARPAPSDIREAREKAGLTQTEAASLVYRGLRNWQQWEAGQRKMDPALWELFQLKTTMNIVHTEKGK